MGGARTVYILDLMIPATKQFGGDAGGTTQVTCKQQKGRRFGAPLDPSLNSAYGLIVSCVVPGTDPVAALDVAVIVVVTPVVTRVASPGVVVEKVASGAPLAFHVTEFVRFWVLPSEKFPVAVNCTVGVPALLTVLFAGITVMLVSVRFTVTVAVPGVAVPETA